MMEISKCVFKQKDDIHLSNGSRLMTVEFSHNSCEDVNDMNGHHYITQKSLPVQPPKFGPFTLTLIPKEEQQAKLANLKYVLQETTDAGNDLLEQTPGDQNGNTEIPEQVTEVNELYTEVNDLVDGALTNEKENLAKHGEFKTLFDSFNDKVGSLEQRLENAKPLSTKLPELKAEQEELMIIREEVLQQESSCDQLLEMSDKMAEENPGPESDAMKQKVQDTTKRWRVLLQVITKRVEIIEEVVTLSEQFEEEIEIVVTFITITVKTLADLKPVSYDQEPIEKEQEKLKALEDEVKEKQPVQESVTATAAKLAEHCEADVDEMMARVDEMNKNWNEMNGEKESKDKELQKMRDDLAEYEKQANAVQEKIGKVEKALPSETALVLDLPQMRNNLASIKNAGEQLEAIKPQLDNTVAYGNELVGKDADIDGSNVKRRNEELQELCSKVDEKVKDETKKMQDLVDEMEQYAKSSKDLKNDLDYIHDEVDANKPGQLDMDSLKKKDDAVKKLKEHVKNTAQLFETFSKDGQQLIGAGLGSDPALIKEISTISKEYHDVTDSVDGLQAQLDDVIAEVAKFEAVHDVIDKELKLLEDKAEAINAKPVGGEPDDINAQLEEVKACQNDIAKVQESIQTLQDLKYGLTARYRDSDATPLDKIIEELNHRLMAISHGLVERQTKLDQALLQSGKFKETADSLLDWLSETRDLFESQGPVSAADPNLLKAQIKENQLLVRMIKEREGTLMSVQATADELLKTADPDKKQEIEEQMHDINSQWEELTGLVAKRGDQLQEVLEISQKFTDLNKELTDSLRKTDKKAKAGKFSEVKAKPEEIKEQINEFGEIVEEFNTCGPKLAELEALSETLIGCATEEDAGIIEEKVEDVKERYWSVEKRVKTIEDKQNEALRLAEEFNTEKVLFDEWLEVTETAMDEVDGSEDNGLKQQKLKAVQQSVQNKEPDLKKFQDIGSRLSKTVADEYVVIIEETVQIIEVRWKKLKSRVETVAKDLFTGKEELEKFKANMGNVDEWLTATETKLSNLEAPSSKPDKVKEQIKELNPITNDIAVHAGTVNQVLDSGQTLLIALGEEEGADVKEKLDRIKTRFANINNKASSRQAQLVELLLLTQQYLHIVNEVTTRLGRAEENVAKLQDDKGHAAEVEQERIKAIQESITVLAPLMSNYAETHNDLAKHCSADEVAEAAKELERNRERYQSLRAEIENRGIQVGMTLQQEEQLQVMLEELILHLEKRKDGLLNLEPIGIHGDVVREQLHAHEDVANGVKEDKILVDETNAQVDIAVKTNPGTNTAELMTEKMSRVKGLYVEIEALTNDRQLALESVLEECDKFWDGVEQLRISLRDVQGHLDTHDPPAAELHYVEDQIHEHEELCSELNSHEDQINAICHASPVLVANCGQADKLVVQNAVTEISDLWENTENACKARTNDLAEVFKLAEQFEKSHNAVCEWLEATEKNLEKVPSVGSDVKAVKKQLDAHRELQREIPEQQVHVTTANQHGQALMEKCRPDDVPVVQAEVKEMNDRWKALRVIVMERQQKLEEALLALGQFQLALEELLAWINHTNQSLDKELEQKPHGDVRSIEVEMSKHKIIQNDISAHEPTVKSITNAANKLLESGTSKMDTAVLKNKLDDLQNGWQELLAKSAQRENDLTGSLKIARDFMNEVREMLGWLKEAREFLKTRRPVGGFPESCEKQIEKHKEFARQVESRAPKYEQIMKTSSELLETSDPAVANTLRNMKSEVKRSWEEITSKTEEEGKKLQFALQKATKLHDGSTEMITWLTEIKEELVIFEVISVVFVKVEEQKNKYKNCAVQVDARKEPYRELRTLSNEVTGSCLQEDAILIYNNMADIDKQWRELLNGLNVVKKNVDDNYRASKKFFGSYDELIAFMTEAENQLQAEDSIGADPAVLKHQLKKHKLFQSTLGPQQAKMDVAIKSGKVLIDRGEVDDAVIVEEKIAELKERWDGLCALSVDRQQKLEEALLFTGMFQDALQSLFDWLETVEPGLSSETAIMGDTQTVLILMDNHKAFQRDLATRQKTYNSVVKSGRQCIEEQKVEDPAALAETLDDLVARWDALSMMSNTKQERLENALTLAEEFESGVKEELKTLKGIDARLRSFGPVADNYDGVIKQIEEMEVVLADLEAEEDKVKVTIKKGEMILRFCHPSGTHTIQTWLSRLKKRWAELNSWAKQRKTRLDEHRKTMEDEKKLVEELSAWVKEKEAQLQEKEKIPLPEENTDELKALLDEHQLFQDNLTTRQPDYDQIMRSSKRRQLAAEPTATRKHETPSKTRPSYKSRIPRNAPGATSSQPVFSRGHSFTRDKSPARAQLAKHWQHLWLMSLERMRRIQERLDYLTQKKLAANFSFEEWKKRFNHWLHESKSRVLDIFRQNDHDHDGSLTREQFITGFLATTFPTERWELQLVARKFERRGLISYKEFVAALKAKKSTKPLTEAEQIHDEIERQVSECECPHKFEVTKVAERKYRFGDSQKLRLLRILRSTVMVRVGGGWETLKEFLSKNDPCKAEGRTNFDIHKLGASPDLSSHSMGTFRTKRPGISREGSGADLKDSLAAPSMEPRKKSGTSLKGEKSSSLKKAGSRDGLASPRSSTPTSRVKKAGSHTSVHSDDGKPEASGASATTKTTTKRTSTSTSRVPTPKSTTSRTTPVKSTAASKTATSRIPSPSTTGGASRPTTTTTRTSSGGTKTPTKSTTSTTPRSSTKTTKTTTKSTKK